MRAARALDQLLSFVKSAKLEELRKNNEKAYNAAISEAAALVREYGRDHESWVPSVEEAWLDSTDVYLRKYEAS